MATTYLTLVNNVLARLRENSVSAWNETTYSTLVGRFVNDSKRQVEDAWKWDALQTTKTITTAAGTSTYTVTGSGRRFQDVTVNDTTNKSPLRNVSLQWILDQQQLSTVQRGAPCYYAWNGTDGTDSKMEFYPTPAGVYTIKVNICVPQAELTSDTDQITVLPHAVEMGAYARALVERGEDGGLSSSEAYQLFKSMLSDEIALESTRFSENECWVAT